MHAANSLPILAKETATDVNIGTAQGAGLAITPVDELTPDFDEKVVVERAQQGDEASLSLLYEFYFPRVYRYVASRVERTDDAEDVTSEIFLRVVDKLDSFSWRGLPFGAWVFRIARNEVIDHARKQKTRGATTELSETIPDWRQTQDEAVTTGMLLDAVRDAASRLPGAQRDVLALRFGAGLSVAETAAVLKKSENNVKVLQHNAVKKLKSMVPRD